MMPEKGQHVKCLLRGNTLAEGTIEEWRDNVVKLLSLDEKSLLIIHHPQDDIILTKIILCDVVVDAKDKIVAKQSELEEQFQQVYEQPSGDDLRTKSMVELKSLMAAQEKKIIAEKLKDHKIAEVKEVKYGYPGFLSK
jgi:hypothetical protein